MDKGTIKKAFEKFKEETGYDFMELLTNRELLNTFF